MHGFARGRVLKRERTITGQEDLMYLNPLRSEPEDKSRESVIDSVEEDSKLSVIRTVDYDPQMTHLKKGFEVKSERAVELSTLHTNKRDSKALSSIVKGTIPAIKAFRVKIPTTGEYQFHYEAQSQNSRGQMFVGNTKALVRVQSKFKPRVFVRELLSHVFNPLLLPVIVWVNGIELSRKKMLLPSPRCGIGYLLNFTLPYMIQLGYIHSFVRSFFAPELGRSDFMLLAASIYYYARCILIASKYALTPNVTIAKMYNAPETLSESEIVGLNLMSWGTSDNNSDDLLLLLQYNLGLTATELGVDIRTLCFKCVFPSKAHRDVAERDLHNALPPILTSGTVEKHIHREEGIHKEFVLRVDCKGLVSTLWMEETKELNDRSSETLLVSVGLLLIQLVLFLFSFDVQCNPYSSPKNSTNSTDAIRSLSQVECMMTAPTFWLVLDIIFTIFSIICGFMYSYINIRLFGVVVDMSARRYKMLRRYDSLFAERIHFAENEVENMGGIDFPYVKKSRPIILLNNPQNIRAYLDTRYLIKSLGKMYRIRGQVLVSFMVGSLGLGISLALIARILKNQGITSRLIEFSADRFLSGTILVFSIVFFYFFRQYIMWGTLANEQTLFAQKMLLEQLAMLVEKTLGYKPGSSQRESLENSSRLLEVAIRDLQVLFDIHPVTVLGFRADPGIYRLIGTVLSGIGSVIVSQIIPQQIGGGNG